MDGQEYLSQISSEVRPVKANNGGLTGLLHSKIFLVLAIGVVALIIIMIIGSILGGNNENGGEKNKSIALALHIEGTAEVLKEYQPKIKSSSLRSSCASLYSILTNTDKELDSYLTEKYNLKNSDISKSVQKNADEAKEKLSEELFSAKINGLLDRTMAHKMAYEISILMAEESAVYSATKNQNLQNLLDESYNSLETLYDKFDNFKEGQ